MTTTVENKGCVLLHASYQQALYADVDGGGERLRVYESGLECARGKLELEWRENRFHMRIKGHGLQWLAIKAVTNGTASKQAARAKKETARLRARGQWPRA